MFVDVPAPHARDLVDAPDLAVVGNRALLIEGRHWLDQRRVEQRKCCVNCYSDARFLHVALAMTSPGSGPCCHIFQSIGGLAGDCRDTILSPDSRGVGCPPMTS